MLLKDITAKLLKVVYNLPLKTALILAVNIITIFKKMMRNYRPVSLIFILNKVVLVGLK